MNRSARSLVPLLLIGSSSLLPAQEAVRMSLAGEEAATARKAAAATMTNPNLRLGPTIWSFGADFAVAANDNLWLDHSNPQEDVIFQPQLDTRMLWAV